MYIMSRKTCEGVYQMTYNAEKYKIHRSVMCAGDDNLKAPCTVMFLNIEYIYDSKTH